jgi:hypothetical protein
MDYSFSQWLAETQQPKFLQAMAQGIYNHSHKHPILSYIVSDNQRFSNFLSSVAPVLRSMSFEERQQVAASPAGLWTLMYKMLQLWQHENRNNPEVANLLQGGNDPKKGALKKLLTLASQAARQYDQAPETYHKLISHFVNVNSLKKVKQWEQEINTPEDLMQKLVSWRQRFGQ